MLEGMGPDISRDGNRGSAEAAAVALLVVDVQEAVVRRGPYKGDVVLQNITTLIDA